MKSMLEIYRVKSGNGPSINYVSVEGGGAKIADYTDQKDNNERRGDQKLPILRRHSLWIAPNSKLGFVTNLFY